MSQNHMLDFIFLYFLLLFIRFIQLSFFLFLLLFYVFALLSIKSLMQGSQQDKLKSLVDAIKREDHNQIYQFSKELLKESPEDAEYQQCFIISSLKISLGDELAHNHFKSPPANEAFHELYAYYLYDRGEFDKVIQYVASVKESPKLNLILAQAYFRSQNYEKSAELMSQLIKRGNIAADLRDEYRINFLATGYNKFVGSELQDYEKLLINAERKEMLYNYALVMFQQGKYKEAVAYLNEFQSSLEQGRDQNDIAMVRMFRDYLEWKFNKVFDRSVIDTYERYQEKITDKNVLGVIENNLLFYRQGQVIQNTHQILKMFDEILESEYKMTKRQRGIIHLNKLSVLLRKGRLPQAQKLIKEIETKWEDLLRDSEYIKNKYFLLKKNKDQDLPNFIEQVAKWNSSLAFCLRADLEKERGTQTDLIADLKAPKGKQVSNPIIKNYIFSLLIKHSSLFEQYSDYLAEMAELTTDSNILQILLNVYENKSDIEKQRYILLRLLKLHPKNSNVKVKLAKLYLSQGKIAQAEETLRGIEGPEELGDIAYLQFIQKNIHVSIQKEEDKNEVKKVQNISKKRIKKKKRVRLPKNIEKVIEGFKGDPERWLPKWQRKGYKKKGKKGAGKTQGLATISKQQTKNVFTTGASTSGKEVTKETLKKRK